MYSGGAGLVPNGRRRHSRDILSTMAIHVDAISALACMFRYVVSGYVFLIRMRLVGHLSGMSEILWRILSRKKKYKHGCSISFMTCMFAYRLDGPGKYQSWVTCLFV